MVDIEIMQEMSLILSYLEVQENRNAFLINKVKKVMEGLEFYFGSSEYYAQEIQNIINNSQS
jgi:hypothetical protein